MKIFINPGHDIRLDSGAVNPIFGLKECDVVLSIGETLQNILLSNNNQVYLLQSDNLASVVTTANNWQADIFISLHCNAANRTAHGTETLVYKYGGMAERLATLIQDRFNRCSRTACSWGNPQNSSCRPPFAIISHRESDWGSSPYSRSRPPRPSSPRRPAGSR